MPTWYHMFVQTLTEGARLWFDSLPAGSIDSYEDLSEKFLRNFNQQRKLIKNPNEIMHIRQKDNKRVDQYMERFIKESTPLLNRRRRPPFLPQQNSSTTPSSLNNKQQQFLPLPKVCVVLIFSFLGVKFQKFGGLLLNFGVTFEFFGLKFHKFVGCLLIFGVKFHKFVGSLLNFCVCY
ncbi:putative retrotransposon gag domain-containing protein [Helianthus annuus]|nr:putative retrotransposon gag domain-containing protein [Helianthus annuus]